MATIKFSHRYFKMPSDLTETRLIEVLPVRLEELSQEFIDYDVTYETGAYKLPKQGIYMILFLLSDGQLWTTIRRLTPNKHNYYKSLIGQRVEIQIQE